MIYITKLMRGNDNIHDLLFGRSIKNSINAYVCPILLNCDIQPNDLLINFKINKLLKH